MIRTIIGVIILVGAVLWLPVFVQISLLVVGVIFIPYRLVVFIPAAIADALYAPAGLSIHTLKYTILVAVLLVIHWIMVNKTRVGELYGIERE